MLKIPGRAPTYTFSGKLNWFVLYYREWNGLEWETNRSRLLSNTPVMWDRKSSESSSAAETARRRVPLNKTRLISNRLNLTRIPI